jgi:hypothetical protein
VRPTRSFEIGGKDLAATKKFRDVARKHRAAIVIDEVLPAWRPATANWGAGDGFPQGDQPRFATAQSPFPGNAHPMSQWWP